MYHGSDAVYFSGYSFAIGHLGTTDMDIYASVEIADGARRIVSALRKFQLTMAVGDPDKDVAPRHLEIPPVIADMDVGYGNVFNVQRTTELYVNAGLAAAHIEDQVMPKRCGHIAGKALVPADERGPTEQFHEQVRKRFPDARFAFNYSSSFKWHNEPNPMTFADLAEQGVRFIFITLAAQHAMGVGFSRLLEDLNERQQDAYIDLQREEWAGGDRVPTRSHHLFSGVPYHHHVGEQMGSASRFGKEVDLGREV